MNVLGPGPLVSKPLDALSLGLSLMIGTAGLPHILMRFYTVPDPAQARKSAFYATGLIAFFYLLTFILGFGAMALVGTEGHRRRYDKAYNMAAPLLAGVLGGEPMLGFIAAVAFATILAVVAGLTLSGASALSHDLWVNVVRGGEAPEKEQLTVARYASLFFGALAVVLGLLFENTNVAYMVGLAFAIAASANFPALVPVDLLAAVHHGRRGGEHVGRCPERDHAHRAVARGVARRAGQGRHLPAQEPGAGDDPAFVHGGHRGVAAHA